MNLQNPHHPSNLQNLQNLWQTVPGLLRNVKAPEVIWGGTPVTMTVEHTTSPGPTATLAADTPNWRTLLGGIATALDQVPGWAWLTLAVVLFVALLVMRHRLYNAYRTTPAKAGDKPSRLFYATVAVAAIVWGGIFAASGKNVVGWTRDTLGWEDGWEYVPLAGLDGIAIVFAIVMFAAVQAGRSASRAYRIVWSSTLMSSGIGFVHGYGDEGGLAAAVILSYFALASMAVLHELLDLFRSTTEKKAPRVRPPFGLRWVTCFPNTLCAALAWENHPPRPLPANATEEQTAWWGSVRHAIAHLEVVRRAKRIARYRVDAVAAMLPAPWWARVWPWPRVRQLTAGLADWQEKHAEALAAERAAADAALAAERERHAAELDAVHRELAATRAELGTARRELETTTGLFETASAELDQALAARRAAQERASAAEADAVQARTEAAAARQTVVGMIAEADGLRVQLRDAHRETGRMAAQAETARADAERAAAELRRQLADRDARHAAELAATVDRMTAERDAAVAKAHADAVTAARDAMTPAARDAATTAVTPPATARRGGATSDRSPRRPPWSDAQLAAFGYRDENPTATWVQIAEHVRKPEPTVRRWFRWRDEYAAAGPTTQIPSPKKPVTSGANGTTVNTR